jgi:hypothetical protein
MRKFAVVLWALLFAVPVLAAPTIVNISPACFTQGTTTRIDIYGTGLTGGRAYFDGIAMPTYLIDDTHIYIPNVVIDGLKTVNVRVQRKGWSNFMTFSTTAPVTLPPATINADGTITTVCTMDNPCVIDLSCPSWAPAAP